LVNLQNLYDTLIVNDVATPITIRASYHSNEYHFTAFGAFDSDLYITGDALSIGVPAASVEALAAALVADTKIGEVGLYDYGAHIGWTKTPKRWDKRGDLSKIQFLKNLITNDKMKNIILLAAAAGAGWWFFIRKKS
ncbi:MAG: hypothetical protein ABJA76_22695, partial [Mucilaginibacter sp.]